MLANPKRTKDEIVQWIRSYFESNGPGCDAVVGISGGKDSSVVAALCVEALGKERVVGVMMPRRLPLCTITTFTSSILCLPTERQFFNRR